MALKLSGVQSTTQTLGVVNLPAWFILTDIVRPNQEIGSKF